MLIQQQLPRHLTTLHDRPNNISVIAGKNLDEDKVSLSEEGRIEKTEEGPGHQGSLGL